MVTASAVSSMLPGRFSVVLPRMLRPVHVNRAPVSPRTNAISLARAVATIADDITAKIRKVI